MPRIMSRPSMGRRSSIGSSMNSLSSLGKKDRLSFQKRRERISSSSSRQQQQERYSSHSSLQRVDQEMLSYQQQQIKTTSPGRSDCLKLMERNSTKYFDSVESQKEFSIPSPTVTASTTPMNTPPSVSSFGSYYNVSTDGVPSPPPETTTSSSLMSGTIIHRMQLLNNNNHHKERSQNSESSRSTASTGMVASSNSSIRRNDSWGQFVDVAEAEREIEKYSQYLTLSSRERSYKLVTPSQFQTAFKRLST